MESIWMKDYNKKNLPNVTKDVDVSLLIIGGGIAGLMCAYSFMKNNIDFVLVDSEFLGTKVSANTTAQVSLAHDALYDEISKKHDKSKALSYFKSQADGLNLMKEVIKKENIDCDYKEEKTILGAEEKTNIDVLKNQYSILKKYKVSKLQKYNNDGINYKYAIVFDNGFIINPVKYIMGIIDILIKNKISLYENSKVTKIKKNKNGYEVIINDRYKIRTKKIVMAAHYPFLNPDKLYFAKIYQSKSYAIAFKTKLKLSANYVSLDEPFYYLRTYDASTLIIGGSDHFTGIYNDIEKCYERLIKKIYDLDKKAIILNKWFTEDCMVIDSLPFIGKYSNKNADILLATGFQKWGFTNSMVAARNITNMLLGKPYDDLYKTNRYTLIKDLKSTFRMIGHSINGLVISKLFLKEEELSKIKIGSGKVMKYKDVGVLVYRESENDYLFLRNKCTHMGCSLIWNDTDKVWESKCHGSIFDRYGKVIYGPAIKDLERINFFEEKA